MLFLGAVLYLNLIYIVFFLNHKQDREILEPLIQELFSRNQVIYVSKYADVFERNNNNSKKCQIIMFGRAWNSLEQNVSKQL